MNKAQVTQRVIELLSERGFDDATPNQNLIADLGMDSLDMFELDMDCEKAFNIKIPDSESYAWATVNDVIETVFSIIPIETDK